MIIDIVIHDSINLKKNKKKRERNWEKLYVSSVYDKNRHNDKDDNSLIYTQRV